MDNAKDYSRNTRSETCLHCGTTLNRNQLEFCCTGCKIVHSTLKEIGATEFYEYRNLSLTGDTYKPNLGNQTFEYMDNTSFQVEHVECINQSATVTLQLQGVHCAGCIWLLEKLPQFLPGVLNCIAHLSSGTVVITYNPNRIALSKIAQFIVKIGYTPHLFSATSAMTIQKKEMSSLLTRLGVAAFCTGNIMLVTVPLYQGASSGIDIKFYTLFRWSSFLLFLPIIVYCAVPFLKNAWASLRLGQLHLDLPIALSLVMGSIFSTWNLMLGVGDLFFDSLAMLIFLLLAGRYWLNRALFLVREKTQLAAHCLPIWARLKNKDNVIEVPLSALKTDDIIEVRPGEILPADGVVESGHSMLNISILTGESLPLEIKTGAKVFAGALNTSDAILIKVSCWGKMSRFGKITEDLTKETDNSKVSVLVDRAARYFAITIIFVSLFVFFLFLPFDLNLSINRAMAISVIACPCALGLATPATVAFGIARLASERIFVRGAATLEKLTKVKEIHLDKTGTLTLPTLSVSKFTLLDDKYENEIFSLVVKLCKVTPFHPISKAILEYVLSSTKKLTALQGDVKAFAGRGVSYQNGTTLWRLGSQKWLQSEDITTTIDVNDDSLAVLACDNKVVAYFQLTNQLHPLSSAFVRWLFSIPYKVKILSGDRDNAVRQVAQSLGISPENALGELYPEEKEAILKSAEKPCLMVGDGMNDCAAIRAADIGIALGGGVEFLLDRADIVIQDQNPLIIKTVILKSLKVYKTIKRGLLISVVYNIVGVVLAALGYIDALVAAVLMPLSSGTVILHAYWSSKRM